MQCNLNINLSERKSSPDKYWRGKVCNVAWDFIRLISSGHFDYIKFYGNMWKLWFLLNKEKSRRLPYVKGLLGNISINYSNFVI